MTGESVKDCRWCEKCRSYHPVRTKCVETVRERADRELRIGLLLLAQTILAIVVVVLVGALLVYWFNHSHLTQMELLIDQPFLNLVIITASIGFIVCGAAE